MYLHRSPHKVYYYRRPVSKADQAFWRGPNGGVKREWNLSLETHDRATAIERMPEAARAYAAERDRQLAAALDRAAIAASMPLPVTMLAQDDPDYIEGAAALDRDEGERLEWEAAHDPVQAAKRDELAALRDDRVNRELWRAVKAEEAETRRAVEQTERGRTVSQLIEAYEADKAPGWSGSSKKAVVPVFRLLRDVFSDRPLSTVTREDARAVVALLQGLPTQLGKRKELEGLSMVKAVEKGRVLGLPTIQPKTINDGYLLHIASMWNWAVKEQWITSSPFKGLAVHDPVADEDRRDPFKLPQLCTLFSSAPWDAPWTAGKVTAGTYWVPLLCLFHGFRNAEAAGLRVVDVEEEEGVALIRIKAYGGRALKNASSRGTIPVHPELVRLGFLDFVGQRRAANAALLFDEGVANSRGQVAAKLAERFSKHVRSLGLKGQKLGTHSFRHNFEDRIREAELVERTALAIARRSEKGSGKVYGSGLSARVKAAAIAKIVYPGLNLSHLYTEAAEGPGDETQPAAD